MIKDDAQASDGRAYPADNPCPFLGLRKPVELLIDTERDSRQGPNTTCHKRRQKPEECEEAAKYYGEPGSIREGNCSSSESLVLCHILENNTERENCGLSCNVSKCEGKPIMLGYLNDSTGMVSENDWWLVSDAKLLGELLRRQVSSSEFGGGFALLKCAGKAALQVLALPKILRGSWKRPKYRNIKQRQFNINIVVEDSLSRSHFFRTLVKTASAFRKIIYDQSIPATVLDYEMVQSYASTTYKNIQRLFTGRTFVGYSNKLTYGVEKLFAQFKKWGYTTLFQEDSCWYDTWGSILDPRQRIHRVVNKNVKMQTWKNFVDILGTNHLIDVIDDYGMTFLTCTAYKDLNATNVFDGKRFPKVCWKGRHYSSLFLEYVEEYVKANDESNQPFLSYTHLLTSHERKGRRIVNDDATLSSLFLKAAYLRNTITMFASDHGGKATSFSTYTTQGRQEVFQPLLFIIVPHQVAEKLGFEIMNSLVVNQKRLTGLEDLHHALLSLNDIRSSRTGVRPSGLFQTLPLNRTCDDLVLKSDVLCLCEGMDKFVANDSFMVLWAAEYALGYINNKIQNQYIASLKSKHAEEFPRFSQGYGACQRYTGLGITRARHTIPGQNQTLQFSLFVQPLHLKTVEVFDVQVTFPVEEDNGIELNEVIRVSMFNVYEQCADDGVYPKLCACNFNDTDKIPSQKEFIAKVYSEKSFALQPSRYVLDFPCLAIISRTHKRLIMSKYWQNAIVTYEALNECALVTYNLTVDIKEAFNTRLSATERFTLELFPRTMTFLMTIKNDWKYGKVVPKFEFQKKTLTE